MDRRAALTLACALAAIAATPARAQHKSYYYRPVTREAYQHSSTSEVWRDENGDGINDADQHLSVRKRYTYTPVHRDRHLYSPYRYQPNVRYPQPQGHRSGTWWGVGSRMPSQYYAPLYDVDYQRYRLPPPPSGFRWVRVENDVYLVHSASGLIRDALYQLFY